MFLSISSSNNNQITMLTLTHNWKEYKWADEATEIEWAWLTNDTIKNMIRVWLLIELKEKPLSQKRAEAIERGKEVKVEITEDEHWQYDNWVPIRPKIANKSSLKVEYSLDWEKKTMVLNESSILEKLREELERRKNTMKVDNDEVESIYEELLEFLTSLEKEEPTEKDPWEEASQLCNHIVKKSDPIHCLKCWEVLSENAIPQFTPWQMIEVSNDREKWLDEPRKFIAFRDWEYHVSLEKNNMNFYEIRKYARPQPQEDIELLPKWTVINNQTGMTQNTPYEQIELLTNAVNQLIKANKKPL